MYKIETKGYSKEEKLTITKDYLLPAIQKQVNFSESEIIISDDIITKIINTYTEDEKGVRNLKRCLEILHTKLNLYRLTNEDNHILFKDKTLKHVSFPYTVTSETLDVLMIHKTIDPFLTTLYN